MNLSHLNVKLLFSVCISIYFSILFTAYVTQVHRLDISNDYNC